MESAKEYFAPYSKDVLEATTRKEINDLLNKHLSNALKLNFKINKPWIELFYNTGESFFLNANSDWGFIQNEHLSYDYVAALIMDILKEKGFDVKAEGNLILVKNIHYHPKFEKS